MKKTVRLLALVTVIVLAFAACTPAVTPEDVQEVVDEVVATPEEVVTATDEVVDETVAVHSNAADFTYQEPEGTVFDLDGYYNPLGVDCAVEIRSTGGTVLVPDAMTDPLPTAAEEYTIGFSVYYTIDEVGSMILETMENAAEECGVTLLVNDANYDQNVQNQAIEQWILQDVDGVILAPCDFYGVKDALDMLEEAGIPVVTLNPPLAGSTDAITSFDCVVQGQQAGEMLEQAIMDAGIEMKGKIVYQTLPFIHPNAATRALGFKQVFEKYPDIELIELTGISPEEHYTAFEGALQAYPDMIGAWGLYSSATIGMMNAKLAADSDVLLSSVDNDKLILKGIYDGNIVGSACYSSIWPARWTMSQMVNLLNGVEIPGMLYGANMAVTQENVEEAFELYYPGQTLQGFMAGTE